MSDHNFWNTDGIRPEKSSPLSITLPFQPFLLDAEVNDSVSCHPSTDSVMPHFNYKNEKPLMTCLEKLSGFQRASYLFLSCLSNIDVRHKSLSDHLQHSRSHLTTKAFSLNRFQSINQIDMCVKHMMLDVMYNLWGARDKPHAGRLSGSFFSTSSRQLLDTSLVHPAIWLLCVTIKCIMIT